MRDLDYRLRFFGIGEGGLKNLDIDQKKSFKALSFLNAINAAEQIPGFVDVVNMSWGGDTCYDRKTWPR